MKFYTEQLSTLEDKLSQIDNEVFIYKRAELAVIACQDCLTSLRLKVSKSGFKNPHEECFFFKHIKPKVVGYLYFYINLIELERNRPLVEGKHQDRFLAQHVFNLRKFFLEHRAFYEYYLREQTHKDVVFFCRNTHSTDLHFKAIRTMVDSNFNTTHDLILARIIGNTKTINYIRNQIFRRPNMKGEFKRHTPLRWTGSKVDLVELVYALHYSGLVNNGQAGINELADIIENIFAIKLGDIYRTFLEIRTRKKNPTKLLDTLKTRLINKMIEADA